MVQNSSVHIVAPEMAIEFFKGIMPFDSLDDATLDRLARNCRVDFYPQGTRLLTTGETDITHLYLIQRGGVKAFIEDELGEETLKDFRGVGAYIGALGIIRGTPANLNIETVEDTFCFLLPKEIFLELVEQHPSFAHYYLKSFSEKVVSTAYNQLRRHKVSKRSGDDLYLFSVHVGELVKKLHTISSKASIQQAASSMTRNCVGSLLVYEPDDRENIVGIITDTDFRRKVVAKGLDYDLPVSEIMSGPVERVLSQSLCFDALLQMMSASIHHLAVERRGRIIGVVTSHDIMLIQGHSPYYLFKEIRGQHEAEGLYALAKKIPDVIRGLIKEGAKAGNITQMIAILNDHILERLLTLLEEELGPPPVAYCWLFLGSEGRREQTFKTDQDNAILYADPANSEEKKAAEVYFREFSEKAIDHLVNCGYPLCPGEIMATNPRWCQPLAVWKDYFSRWIDSPDPGELLNATIFFDFRSGYGDSNLAQSLRSHLNEKATKKDVFLFHLARQCVSIRIPLSFFKNFIVNKDGEHKNRLDIKHQGLTPFVNFARILALKHGISETNTLARLKELLASELISHEMWSTATDAYELQMQQRLIHQLRQIEEGKQPDNHINPEELSDLERRMLKEAFAVIERLYTFLDQMYPVP